MTDSEIEQQVLRSLTLNATTSSREICIESQGGVVTLRGTVPTSRESSAILFATHRAPGVRGVISRIAVTRNGLSVPQHSRNVIRSPHPFSTLARVAPAPGNSTS